MQPAMAKLGMAQPATIIVPATSVAASSLQSRLLPVVGPSLVKPADGLQAIKPIETLQAVKLASGEQALLARPASATGTLLSGMRTPPPVLTTRSLTPVAAPASTFTGPSSGRSTPVNALLKSSLHSTPGDSALCMSPSEKINLKINSTPGAVPVDSPSSSELDTSPLVAGQTSEKTSIGTLGSLSMKTLDSTSPESTQGKGEFIRIEGSSLRIGSGSIEEKVPDGLPPMEVLSALRSPAVVSRPNTPLDAIEGSSRTGQTYRRARQRKVRLCDGASDPVLPTSYLSQNTELHPVVDHDYCRFKFYLLLKNV